jgi:phospholipid/cholesterol/gamma-HCH transport system permease protein
MAHSVVGGWNRIGTQIKFNARSIREMGIAVVRYRTEILRLIAQMSLGTGALALIGGTVAVVGFMTLTTGAVIAVQGYNELGAGATAQLGAMRIADEIDALEVMAVRSVAYLVSTRVIAGVVVVIPLYCVAMVCAFLAARFGTTGFYHQSTGVYDHYFNTFLNSTDLLWSFFTVILMGIAVMLVHTYYGYTATGGPAGVGAAVGRSVRTSLIVLVLLLLAIALSIYGQSGNFHLSG